MADQEKKFYIPQNKIAKSRYLKLKKLNEKYESVLNIWGTDGESQKTRKLKAKGILDDNPELTDFRTALATKPSKDDSKLCEGFRYWIMKENGTLPGQLDELHGSSLPKEG